MPRTRFFETLLLLPLLISPVLAVAASQVRNPAIVARGPWPQLVLALGVVGSAACALLASRRRPRLGLASGAIALAIGAWALGQTYEAWRLRASVAALPADRLAPVAAHVIAGYYTLGEAEALSDAGVAGLFVSARNARGRSIEAIAGEIASLQRRRAARGQAPLIISADQEGGIVATLSPPLPRPAAIASVASNSAGVVDLAAGIARDLKRIGVTVDFAPVVDVSRGTISIFDRNTRIAARSISSDPATIVAVAAPYCRTLEAAGISCTLKHFPGIGGVSGDTHVASAHLAGIAAGDVEPFRKLAASSEIQPWVMVSHVVVDSLDPTRPASAVPKVIGLLRGEIGFRGPIVTDDASMAAFRGALSANAVSSLGGGVDYLLASYDPDVAFRVIAALADVYPRDGALRRALAESDARLAVAARR